MTEDANRSMPPSTRSQPEEYSVSLPCPPDMFAEFVAKLLGKSQLIEQSIPGPFSITKDDVVNTFHLVNQRVTQQNEAVLIQFSVKTVYQDGSAVMNNSFEDFQHYTEVRPLVSIGVHLSWIYLIKFPDKTVPEKQVIELSFSASGLSVAAYSLPGPPVGAILLRIHHTARTWGVDLESLLTNHIKGLLIEEPKWKEVIRRYSQKIGTAVGLVFLCIVLVGVFLSTNNFVNNQMNAAQAVIDTPVSAAEGISYKLDFLLHRAASGDWARFIFACLIFLVFASLMSIIIGSWAGTAAHNSPRSFVLLSRKAEEVKTKALEKRRNRWVSFIASIITSVVAGLIARFIFEIADKRWIHLP